MSKNSNKGFTLIELLVVIAIIGLLASVALASLNQARAKAADAAVKQNLVQIRSQAELVFSNTDSYATLFAPGSQGLAIYNAALAQGFGGSNPGFYEICSDTNPIRWQAWVRLKGSAGTTIWYVDGSGKSEMQNLSLGLPLSSCVLIIDP